MKSLFLALGLTICGLAHAEASGTPPAVPAATPAAPSTFIANGERIEIKEAAFTIVPPSGWEVLKNFSGASYYFQAPKIEAEPGVVTYQSNIRVMVLNEPKPIDDTTKDEVGKLIVDKNGALPGITNYAIRSADKVTLQGGAEGFLYYTEFSLGSTPMMQMHIMTSSATKTFLMTYTDLASVFEAENSPGLTTAYTSLQSATVDSKPAERFAQYYVVGGGVLALILLLIIIRVIRGFNMKRLGEKIESEDPSDTARSDDDDDDPYSDAVEIQSSVARIDDEDMPETREATKPMPKVNKPVAAPTPPPAAKAAPKAPSVPKPAPVAPAAPAFARDERTKVTGTTPPPLAAAPQSEHDEWQEAPASELVETKPKTVVTTKKAKPQKVANPAKMKDLEADDQENSEVARISEILPNTGDSKKKKGFFSWGKGKKDDDDEIDMSSKKGHIGDEDSWDEESQKAPKGSSKSKKGRDEPEPLSEVAGWNLDSKGKSRHDEDDE